MDKLWESFTNLLDNFFPNKIELLVCDLLESCTLHINDDSDLVDSVAYLLLTPIELLPPGTLKFSDNKFSHCFQICLLKYLV